MESTQLATGGKWDRFQRLPSRAEVGSRQAADNDTEQKPGSGSAAVLIIDDDPMIHQVFDMVLGTSLAGPALPGAPGTAGGDEMTFDVAHAMSGEEGVSMLERRLQENDPFAVVFCDNQMGSGWTGVETIPHLRSTDPAVQIVLCTAYRSPDEQDWKLLGYEDSTFFLKKPFDPTEVKRFAKALSSKRRQSNTAEAAMHSRQQELSAILELVKELKADM